jgi:hypothetical protein
MKVNPDANKHFTKLFERLADLPHPVVISDAAKGEAVDISMAGARDIGTDNTRRVGYKALSLLRIGRVEDKATGVFGKVRETIELYEDPEGNLTACFGDSVTVASIIIGGNIYGHPHREHVIPPQSVDMAVNSALLAMELALQGRTSADS